jgi:flagellar motor protein MotB
VKRARFVFSLGLVALLGLSGSGCALQNLKDANRRLKESNDRLISENNRLEEELAALQRKLGEGGAVSPANGRGSPEEMEARKGVASAPGRNGAASSADPKKGSAKGFEDELLIDSNVEVSRTSQGIRLRIPDQVFFPLGQATLSVKGQGILDKVARVINGKDFSSKMVRVDGHTDDTPIRKVRHIYPTNWELSSARACTVVRYLVDRANVNARRIYPAGFSYYRPVSSTRGTKSQNRRVEITILNENA